MYNQPMGFSVPSAYDSVFEEKGDFSNRLGFDIAGFVSAAGLGEPVGANWFEVQNTTAAVATSATATASSTTASSTTDSSSTSLSESITSTTSTSETMSTAEGTTAVASQQPSSSTMVVVASQTPASSPPSSPSASASITHDSGSGTGLINAYGRTRVMFVSLMLSVAGLWLL